MSEYDERDDYDDEPWRRRRDAAEMVRSPAAFMSAIGMIQLAFSILGLSASLVGFVWNLIEPDDFQDEWAWLEILIAIFVSAICVVLNWFIVRAVARFRAFKSYRIVVVGTILFLFSVPFYYCGLLSFPVGIWALVVLSNAEVRARFEAVARGEMSQAKDHAKD